MVFYLSDITGKSVLNASREKIGITADFVVKEIDKTRPKIHGFIVTRGRSKQAVFIPSFDIKEVTLDRVYLTTDVVNLTPYIQRADEILLAKDVYDKQIVDIDDRRLTRVNDLLLDYSQRILFLKGVDVSSVGILKRLGLPVLGLLKRNVIDWEDVQFLGGNSPVKFKIQYKNLESLHPVDIARIIFEGPGYKLGSRVLSELKDPIAADIIEELSPKLQKNLIESMKLEDVANVIEHMSPDKATDLLVTLGPVYTQKVFPHINKEVREVIKELLNYPEHTTGAFMTTDYLAVPAGITIEELYDRMRKLDEIPDFSYYVYVLENEFSNRLTGVLSNHDFLVADPRIRVDTIMTKGIIVAYPHDSVKDTLKKMYRYNISAVPVISKSEGKLLGIVTFRSAISIYLPRRWKIRIRRVLTYGA